MAGDIPDDIIEAAAGVIRSLPDNLWRDGKSQEVIAQAFLAQRYREWRCFHCRQIFTDFHAAQAHFGKSSSDDPECLRELARLGPYLLETRSAKNKLERDLRTMISHVEHMAAFIAAQNLGYSFESLSEDMGNLASTIRSPELKRVG